MFKSLKSFIMGGILVGALAIFVSVYSFSYILFNNLLEAKARETSRVISLETFNTMFQVMRLGWNRKQVEAFIEAARSSFENSTFDVDIFRGPVVEELFGAIQQKEMDSFLRQTFKEGRSRTVTLNNTIRYAYPLHARSECLKCHVNAKKGDVLGVIEVHQDLNPLLEEARRTYIYFLIFFIPVPVILSLLIASFVGRKVNRSIQYFRQRMENVNSVKDIKNLEMVAIDLGFAEINQVFHNVMLIIDRMKNIAIDKDILEFEIKLMDKFIITSDVVKDWKEYIKDLLREINTIIEAYSLFTIFRIDDEEYDLEIFWRGRPGDRQRALLEDIIKQRLARDPNFHDFSSLEVNHNVVDAGEDLPPLARKDLELETKTLILDSPKIGGVVGIGVQSELVKDPTRFIVIESILTTLLNVVGSVKAIYKYTKDLEYFATRDPLTNLYNQRVFWDLLGYEVGRAARHDYKFSLMMVDLDNFKTINDRYGHSFGDLFLKEFAATIRNSTRDEDILARYGGDEFSVILPETDENQAYLIALRIKENVERIALMGPDSTKVKGTVSIGITIYPDHATTSRDLFLVADNMMYRAKKEGKNTLMFPTEEDVAEVFKEAGEKSLMILNAIEENLAIPYFQPIVNMKTGEVGIHELLMRIKKDGRIICAAEFIDVAENMGVIHKLDFMILQKAFEQKKIQNYQGLLFVNLSPRALIIGEFIHKVKQLALDYEIDTSSVIFEITERDTVRNVTLLESFVRDLKTEGFKFAIDDFGSGFSSFSYIKRFPIDYIKIDGDFIRNMIEDPRDLALVKSIHTLAGELGIHTVAEYVEDEEIHNAVRAAGIDFAQGYYLGRPAPEFYMDEE